MDWGFTHTDPPLLYNTALLLNSQNSAQFSVSFIFKIWIIGVKLVQDEGTYSIASTADSNLLID